MISRRCSLWSSLRTLSERTLSLNMCHDSPSASIYIRSDRLPYSELRNLSIASARLRASRALYSYAPSGEEYDLTESLSMLLMTLEESCCRECIVSERALSWE